MRIMIVDGQGGRLGKLLVEGLRQAGVQDEIIAIGTNSMATFAMMKAGADAGATGENPVVVCSRDADYILGPLGILVADSLAGEVTATMTVAIGQSKAQKILIPVDRCRNTVVGMKEATMSELVREAVARIVPNTRCKSL